MAMTRRTTLMAMTAFAAIPSLGFGAGGGSGGGAVTKSLRIGVIGAGCARWYGRPLLVQSGS